MESVEFGVNAGLELMDYWQNIFELLLPFVFWVMDMCNVLMMSNSDIFVLGACWH